jgi:alpha-ribazole phosphatase
MTRWWWVRHARVTCNNGRCYGQTDVPCDLDDAAGLGGLARVLPAGAVWVTSPLRRTWMTAAAVVAAGGAGPSPIPGPALLQEPALMEQNFGDWQGVAYAELARRRGGDAGQAWMGPAEETPPNGESFAALTRRVHRAVTRLSRTYAGRDIVAVTHAGTIRAALGLALDATPDSTLAFVIDNLSLTRIDRFDEPAGWRVGGVNLPAA